MFIALLLNFPAMLIVPPIILELDLLLLVVGYRLGFVVDRSVVSDF